MEECIKRITELLDEKAMLDPLFADNYMNKGKKVEDAWKYVCQEVKKLAKNGMYCATDEFVLGLAVHYFDEDIKLEEKPVPVRTAVTSEAKEVKPLPTATPQPKPKKDDLFVGSLF